jgi:hypothetical protein
VEDKSKSFFIGFDRYVQLDWCGLTLEAATESKTAEDVKAQIAEVLTGVESRRKTFDILKRLWLQPLPEFADFSKRGIELFRTHETDLVAPLNWGCAMVTYPFFGKTAEITGRLLSIQGDCSIKEVQRRMAEIYGDRDGVARAVSRVLQSQESWGLIERVEKGKRLVRRSPISVTNDRAVAWLIEAALRYTGKAIPVATLQSMAVIYPFLLDQPLGYLASNSPMLEVRSEGPSNQLVALRETI